MSDQKLLINDPALELAIDRHPPFVTPKSPVTEIIPKFDRLNLSGCRLESNNSAQSKKSESANLDQFGSGYALVVSESFIHSQQESETTPKLPMRSQILGIVTELDILRVTAPENNLQQNSTNCTAAELMNSEIISLNQADRPDMFAVLSLWRKHGMIPLLLYDQQEQLLGAIAPESIIYQNIQLQQTVVHQTEALATTRSRLETETFQRQQLETTLQTVQNDLKEQVEQRTLDLKTANELLKQDILRQQEVETALRISESQSRQQAKQLQMTIEKLQKTQAKLIQVEKMSGLGQLVAGIAHEINNPINFIYGNITHANVYIKDLLQLVELYQQQYPQPVEDIQELIEDIELDFLTVDLPKVLQSMQSGSERIRHIVQSLRNFSRLDEAAVKEVDLHQGIESTLLILQHRFKGKLGKPNIEICKNYGNLPKVECYPSLLNQVFMNLLNNALDALEDRSPPQQIAIATKACCVDRCQLDPDDEPPVATHYVRIAIADNGKGMDPSVQTRMFEPFFTTKPVGKGTGLGLSISYQIVVEKHHGKLDVVSVPGKGTELIIEIPIKQPIHHEPPLFNE